MSKKKKYALLLSVFALVILIAGYIGTNQSKYTISKDVSSIEIKPINNIVFKIEADKKACIIQIQNNSEHYIVTDLQMKPVRIEIQQEGGWHRLLPSKQWVTDPGAISEGTEYSAGFKWKDVLGGNLKSGTYRAICYVGDGEKEIWDWYTLETTFQID